MLLRSTAIALLTVTAVPAAAQSLSGFTADAAYSSYDNDDFTALQGSGEFMIAPQFGVGGGVGLYSSDDLGDLSNFTARGLYYLSPNTAVGLFVATDDIDGTGSDTVGLEFGYGSTFGSFEAFYGVVESEGAADDLEESLGGLLVEFNVGQNIFISLESEAYDADSEVLGTLTSSSSIGARYAFADGPSVFAEYGSTSVRVTSGGSEISDDAEEYIAIGAQFDLGNNGGAMMSSRSIARAFGF